MVNQLEVYQYLLDTLLGFNMSGIINATNLEVANIKDSTGTNTAMTVASTGRVKQPNLVAWNVFRNATMSSSGDVTYTGSHLNVGTCVNLSTGVFTAPVAGTYFISFISLGHNSGSGNVDIFLYLNGSKDTNIIALRGLGASSTESLSSLPSGSAVMSLSASDEVKINVNQTLYSDGNNWIRFSGFLIG